MAHFFWSCRLLGSEADSHHKHCLLLFGFDIRLTPVNPSCYPPTVSGNLDVVLLSAVAPLSM
jgi:hypothetical protein